MTEPPDLSPADAAALDRWIMSGAVPRRVFREAYEYAATAAGVTASEAEVSVALASDDSAVGRAGRWVKHYLSHLRTHGQPPTPS